ncbi:MAG: MFS transporter [Alphaproteobacteria bacterium]|nr:MFS transporter [Alphaproteobacteria bacterium]
MSAPTRWRVTLYALPGIALAIPTLPVYVYLPAFYAETVGLGLAATGAILFAARSLDVITDPLVGVISDRWPTRFGRRKPWMAAGAALAAVALVRLLDPPGGAGGLYLLAWSALLYLGWTLISIPYAAWGAEMTEGYHARARITAAREAAMLAGIVIAGATPALAARAGVGEADALALIGWLAIAAGAPTLVALLAFVREPKASPSSPAATATMTALAANASPRAWRWRALLANGPFLRLGGAWLLNGLANGIPAALLPLYLKHGLKADTDATGVLILAYFLAGVAAVPLWLALSRRIGKHRAWCTAMLAACAAFVWVPFIPEGGIAAFFAVCLVTGAVLGADLALPPALQADVIDLDTLLTGERRAGLFFALWGMATKLSLAAAVGLALPALAFAGFDPNAPTAPGLWALAVIYAWVPLVTKLCATFIVWRHPITARRHLAIRRRLAAKGLAEPPERGS